MKRRDFVKAIPLAALLPAALSSAQAGKASVPIPNEPTRGGDSASATMPNRLTRNKAES